MRARPGKATPSEAGLGGTLLCDSFAAVDAISTIKAQGKEWSKVAAILGTSHRGAFLEDCYVQCTRAVEDTVVFYRKDLDKSLLSTTETFSASHDISDTSSKVCLDIEFYV